MEFENKKNIKEIKNNKDKNNKRINHKDIQEFAKKKNFYLQEKYQKIRQIIEHNAKFTNHEMKKKNNNVKCNYVDGKVFDCIFSNGFLISYRGYDMKYTLISSLWKKFNKAIRYDGVNYLMYRTDFIYQVILIYSISQDYLHKINLGIEFHDLDDWLLQPIVMCESIQYLFNKLYLFTNQLFETWQNTIYLHIKGSFFINLQLWNLYVYKRKAGYYYVINTDSGDPLKLGMTLACKLVDSPRNLISIKKNLERAFQLSLEYWKESKYEEKKKERIDYVSKVYNDINTEIKLLLVDDVNPEIQHKDNYKINGDINHKIKEIRSEVIHYSINGK
jgi:hypothetical protein